VTAVPDFDGVPVLVTGGAGFIGSRLVDALVERGARVRVLDDLSTGRRSNLASESDRIEFFEGDIRDLDACRRACAGARFVFHEAALGSVPRSMKDPASTFAVNVSGTANVFSAARDESVETIVYASSSSVYGDSAVLPKREGEEGRPVSPYALSKSMTESLAECFARVFSMKVVGLRYFNVYGPRQSPEGPYAAVIPRFLQAIAKGSPLTIFGDGEQKRDFTFVSDAVAANLLAAGAPPALVGRVFNVAAGEETSVNTLAARLCELSGARSEILHLAPREGDVRESRADLSRSRRELGFEPAVSLEEGLRKTVEAYRELQSV
jgi:nucleoside-diphosphate-sugar epimerase